MFNMFEELFAPGRKHTNDERKRLELTRVDLNDGDPGRGPIDLTSGKVVVRAPRHDDDEDRDEAEDDDGQGEDEDDQAEVDDGAEAGNRHEAEQDPGPAQAP